jgi:hypothetical protein
LVPNNTNSLLLAKDEVNDELYVPPDYSFIKVNNNGVSEINNFRSGEQLQNPLIFYL